MNGTVFNGIICKTDADCDGSTGSCIQLDGNINGTGYPCRDQWGRSTNQTLAPTLFWNNTLSRAGGAAVQIYPYVAPVFSDHIKSDRDYCANTACAAGATSCTYTCGSVTVAYTAYTYPHPLTAESDITPPAAPSGLRVQ